MPTLGEKDGVNVEVWFNENRYGWIHYGFRFLCGTDPLFNPAVMQADYVDACELDDDTLVPVLEKVLRTNESATWWPLEPGIGIEIRTDQTKNSFDVTFLIDGSHTKIFLELRKSSYGGDNPAVRVNVNRSQFEKFLKELKKNHQEYLEKNKETIELYKNQNG